MVGSCWVLKLFIGRRNMIFKPCFSLPSGWRNGTNGSSATFADWSYRFCPTPGCTCGSLTVWDAVNDVSRPSSTCSRVLNCEFAIFEGGQFNYSSLNEYLWYCWDSRWTPSWYVQVFNLELSGCERKNRKKGPLFSIRIHRNSSGFLSFDVFFVGHAALCAFRGV